ncbi:8942_t:CDS:2 [Funneliformis geosporum]|uniref:Histone H4 n=1 Tax=Funneliformis geosporum TaxID=1117311 RepID=A0A9W4SNY1_9GLOM|nr:8942_t:CDS:2 [Funneliformis geosporum]
MPKTGSGSSRRVNKIRHRKIIKENIKAITRPAIRRMARRGGVKRISGDIYNIARTCIKDFVTDVLRDCVSYVEYERKKTVGVMEMLLALKRQGRTLYGFDHEIIVFQQLERMFPLLGQRMNIWRDITSIAIKRVKTCSETHIFATTKLILKIQRMEFKKLFLEMIKEILNKSVQQIDDQLIDKLFIICDCNKRNKILNVPNPMSEEILYYIMIRLQSQSFTSSKIPLNVLKATSINELGGLLLKKTIDIRLLQQLLKYSDDELFSHFDATILFGCSDIDDYIQQLQFLDGVNLDQAIAPDFWAFHEKTLDSARRYYKYYQSLTFLNIFEVCYQEDAATKVEYIAQKLMPIVFERYEALVEQIRD